MLTPPEFIEHGGSGPSAVFLHANGFTPRAYRRLLDALATRLSVAALPLRPLWPGVGPPDPNLDWPTLGRDLVHALERRGGDPVIAIGHSMGATSSIFAVAERPDLFRALVLIEPAQVGPPLSWLFRFLPYALRRRGGPAAPTLRRRDAWPDRDAFLADARESRVYSGLDATALGDLADGLLTPCPDGVTLAYSKAWEAHFYTNPCDPFPTLRRLRLPVVALRGAPSMFLSDRRWKGLQRAQPSGRFQAFPDHGHLLPLEAPDLTASAILDSLDLSA